MRDFLMKGTVKGSVVIFCILIAVHSFEAIVLRMDETFFGENFINKVFGILILWLVLRILQWKWNDIGFARSDIVKNIVCGIALSAVVFIPAYTVEFFILRSRGETVRLGFFTAGFSLTGGTTDHSGIGFVLMCVFFNIINVIMEEGTFRGLLYKIVGTNHSVRYAVLFQALLFGIWHIVTPLHNLIDGELDMTGFIGLSIGYIILAGIMGIKWAMLYRMTGSIYMGMADHFCNNCIATNLLHMTTGSGTDELMIVRVMTAQLLSFALVTIYRTRWKQAHKQAV